MAPEAARDRIFAELWTDYLEGELSAEGMERLQALLAADPQLTRRAGGLYANHRLLGLHHQGTGHSLLAPILQRLGAERADFVAGMTKRVLTPASATWRWRPAFLLMAAAALVASLATMLMRTATPAPAAVSAGDEPIATLVGFDNVLWEPRVNRHAGERLRRGPLRLSTGEAILRFDGGALAVVSGPSQVELVSRSVVGLRQGRIAVRAEADAAGFCVRTPAGEARDLGTEFTVSVSVTGETEVQVSEGEVAWASAPGRPPVRTLHAGQAARFVPAQAEEGTPVAFSSQPIAVALRRIGSGPPPACPSADESFDYTPGAVALAQCAGGLGWIGPWRTRQGDEVTRESDRGDSLFIATTSLDGAWAMPPPRGGALTMPAGGVFRVRQLAATIAFADHRVQYLAFRLRRETPAGDAHFRLTLRSSTDFWGAAVGVGMPASGRPTIQVHSRDTWVAPEAVAVGSATLWVVKIVTQGAGQHEAFLHVLRADQALPTLEPSPWTVSTGGFHAEGRLDLVVLSSTGAGIHTVDELRLGSTWDAVTRPGE